MIDQGRRAAAATGSRGSADRPSPRAGPRGSRARAPGPMRVAPGERPARVAEPERHRQVQILRRADPLLRDVAADVDHVRHHALGDEPGAVADHRHRYPVAREERVRGVAHRRVRGRVGHQRPALRQAEERVDADRPGRIDARRERGRRRVLAERRHENEGVRSGPVAAVDARAELRHRRGDVVVQPVRRDPDLRHFGVGHRGDGHRLRGALHVLVEAAAVGLAAEQAGDDALAGERGGPVARLLVVLVVDRLHDRVRHVEPGEVEELERPHPEAGAVAQDAVDLVELGDAFAQRLQRLGAEAAPGVIHDEAGRVLGPDRRVAAPAREGGERFGHPRRGHHAADHLDHLHQRHRVEEVEAADPLRPLARGRDRGDLQRRGVGRDQAVVRHYALEMAEQLALRLQVLDDRLDDDVARGEVRQARARSRSGRWRARRRPPGSGRAPRAWRAWSRCNPAPPARRRRGCRTAPMRMPACAAICAMPRPMMPVPTTPRVRSGRWMSSGMIWSLSGKCAG